MFFTCINVLSRPGLLAFPDDLPQGVAKVIGNQQLTHVT